MAGSQTSNLGDDDDEVQRPADDGTASCPTQQQSQQPNEPAIATFAHGAPIAPKGYVHLVGWRLVVVEICIVDASIVATALVPIERYFDNFLTSNWVVLAYLLTEMGPANALDDRKTSADRRTGFSVVWARASDIFGRKWSIIAAWTIFAAFSLASGLAASMIQLIIFRALQGIGGSGLYSLVNVVIPEITPKKHFGTMTGAAGTVFAISSVLGPVLGGVISQDASWRWIFFINVPSGVITAALVLFAWPGPSPLGILRWRAQVYGKSVAHVLATHIDYFGALLLLASTVLLVFAMQQAGSAALQWSSSTIIATLTVSAVCTVGLLGWILTLHRLDEKLSITPILPWRIITKRILGLSLLSTLLTGFPLFITLIAIPQRYQIVDGLSPSEASIKMMPLLFASAFGSTFAGLCNRTKNMTFYTLLGASCLMVIGCGLLSVLPTTTKVQAALYGYQVVFGTGLGMTFSTVTIIATMESKFGDYAISIGAVSQARILGGAIGFASASIMLSKAFSTNLDNVLSAAQIKDLKGNLNVITSFTPEQQAAVVDSIASSFDYELRICTYITAACVVISMCTFTRHPTDLLKRKRLGGDIVDGKITRAEADREMEKR